MFLRSLTRAVLSAVLLGSLALAGCGGGGGTAANETNKESTTTAALTGTAAVGAPLAKASVTLKDSAGKTLTITADANGAYTFSDVSALTAPLMLQATGTAGGVEYKLHSVMTTVPAAGVKGVLNVTPATESAVAQTLGESPATVFDATDAGTKIKAIDTAKLDNAKAKLAAALADVLKALGQDAKADLFSTAFSANGKGLDKLLDMIQFEAQTSADGSTKDVVITNKATKVATTVTAVAKVDEVKKVTAPTEADAALDTSSIKTLIDALSLQAKTAEGKNSAAMLDLFATNFLEDGLNRTEILNTIPVGWVINDYVLQGCNSSAADGAECDVDLSDKQADGSANRFGTRVKKGSDGKWRLYGMQSPFRYDSKPVVYGITTVGETSNTETRVGFNFYFPGKKEGEASRTHKSAKLEVSRDGGASWPITFMFKENTNCGSDFLPYDSGAVTTAQNTNCSNFVDVNNENANLNNEAILAGKFRFKITAYVNADYTGQSLSHEGRSTQRFFISTNGPAALAANTMGITAAHLGTNSVSFTGAVRSLQMSTETKNAQGSTIATGNTGWSESVDVKALKGVATVAAANTSCKKRDPVDQCNESYGPNAKITRVFLEGRDAQNRGIWKEFKSAPAAPVVSVGKS